MIDSNYHSFLLRLWHVPEQSEPRWRAWLENVETGEKHGFASLDELLAYLKQVIEQVNNPTSEGNRFEVQS